MLMIKIKAMNENRKSQDQIKYMYCKNTIVENHEFNIVYIKTQ